MNKKDTKWTQRNAKSLQRDVTKRCKMMTRAENITMRMKNVDRQSEKHHQRVKGQQQRDTKHLKNYVNSYEETQTTPKTPQMTTK